MPLLPAKRRTRKIFAGILIFLLLLAITFQVFIDRYLEPIIHQRLEKLIVSGSDSLYNFQLDAIDVRFWAASVEVKNLRIKIDSAHYAQREKTGTLPALTFEIDLLKGSIRSIGLFQLVFKKKISIGSIISKDGDISFSRHDRRSNKKMNTDNQPLWKLLQPEILSIDVDKIILNDISLNYTNADSATAFKWKFDHCSAIVDHTKVDSTATADTSRIAFSKNVSIQFNNIKLQTADASYAIEAKQLWYSSEKKIIEAEDFTLHPVLGQQAFYRKVGYDKDRYSLEFPKLKFINFQLPQWISQNMLTIDTIDMLSPVISVYKDRTQPADGRSKFGKYPHQLLENAPFTIRVKAVHISDARVTYTEKSQESKLEGKLVFQKLRGLITNVNNDPEDLVKNSKCIADINGIFMDHSPIHAKFTFHLNQANVGAFEVSADIEKLDAAQLNPITLPLAQASVKSFDMRELHYYIKGTEKTGLANLSMRYNNLEVELKKKDEDGKMKKKGLLSFLVNKLVMYPDNPIKDKERKAVNIQTERIPNKSFFNLVWKTLYASAKDIAIRIESLKKDKSSAKKKK
jgi:hypothetical protein